MKKRLIALVLATFTAIGVLGLGTGTTVKADTFYDTYAQTYRFARHLQDLGKKYHITPRLKNNGSNMEDNKLEDVVAGSEEMQETINDLRGYHNSFPKEYWKARNTFSEIGDGYQQPIYEWIVDIAIRLQKEVKEIHNIPKNKVANFIARAEYELQSANILNKGVDPAYKFAYQAALDDVKVELERFKENSAKQQGGWVKINNEWYFYKNGAKVTGWLSDGGQKYYLDYHGVMYSGARVEINGDSYYFDDTGAMYTGFKSLPGSEINQPFDPYIYYDKNGKIASGWRLINGFWHYFKPEYNDMVIGWQKIDGKEYYFTELGRMVQGSATIDGKAYKFADNGEFLGSSHSKTGWMLENNDWCFYIDGVKQKGWLNHNNKWYFLNNDGKIHRGWLTLNGKKYWLKDNGIMIDKPTRINGILHNFDKSGAWIGYL